MFTRFSSKPKNIFLDLNSQSINLGADVKKVNIILSPSMYWVKKVSLPVKNKRDAFKLLPSLFEEILPEGEYSYTLYKEGEYFFIFAYESRYILDALKKFDIPLSKISGIYFAQSELNKIESALKVNDTQSIYVKDDIVVLVPCCWIEESDTLNADNIKLSKHRVDIKHYTGLQSSALYKVVTLLLMLCFVFSFEYYITLQKSDEILKRKKEIFLKNNLKPTMFQNKSMLKKYMNIHNKQTKIREYISYISHFGLKTDEKLSKIELKKAAVKIEILNANNATLHKIERFLKSKKVRFETRLQNSKIYLEMIL